MTVLWIAVSKRQKNPWLAVMVAAGCSAAWGQQAASRDLTTGFNILHASEEREVEFLRDALDDGLPGKLVDTVAVLSIAKSTLALPIIEQRIEHVLQSPDPGASFRISGVNVNRFIEAALGLIEQAGDVEALRQIAKLMVIDEPRFARGIALTLMTAQTRRNPFTVAYGGLEIGDKALSKGVITWVKEQVPGKTEFRKTQIKNWWADAMLARSGGRLPTEREWSEDPMVSQLPPAMSVFMHDLIFRAMIETIGKQPIQKP